MAKIDWSKPIEVYYPFAPLTPPEPAEVVATGLRGAVATVGIRWLTGDGMERLVRVEDNGSICGGTGGRVRNVIIKVTKYILLPKETNGENQNSTKVVTMYSTYEEAKANCDESHKIVEVAYEE